MTRMLQKLGRIICALLYWGGIAVYLASIYFAIWGGRPVMSLVLAFGGVIPLVIGTAVFEKTEIIPLIMFLAMPVIGIYGFIKGTSSADPSEIVSGMGYVLYSIVTGFILYATISAGKAARI